MSKIINSGLDQYGAESFKQQQFGTAGSEGVKQDMTAVTAHSSVTNHPSLHIFDCGF